MNGETTVADETPGTPWTMPEALKVEKAFALPGIAFCAAKGADAKIYIGTSDFGVHRVDAAAEKPVALAISEAKHQSYVTGLAAVGNVLISGGYDGALIWWNRETGEVIRRLEQAHAKWIRDLTLTPDGTRLVTVADDMRTKVWDVETGAAIADWGDYDLKTPHSFPSMLYTVAVSPNGSWVATGDKTGRNLVRSLADGTIAATVETPVMYTWDPKARRHSIGGVRSVAFSSDSALLAIGGMGKVGNIDHLEGASRIELFRWQTQERLHEIEDPKLKGLVESLRFSSDDRSLFAAGGDNAGFLSVYDVASGKLSVQERFGEHVHDFVLNEQERTVVCVGHHRGALVKV